MKTRGCLSYFVDIKNFVVVKTNL